MREMHYFAQFKIFFLNYVHYKASVTRLHILVSHVHYLTYDMEQVLSP